MQLGYDAASIVCDVLSNQLDDGYILFHDASHSEVAKPQFNDPSFGDAEEGSATMSTSPSVQDPSSTGGTIDHAHLVTSDETILTQCTCGLSAAEFIFSSLTIGAGEALTLTLVTLTITGYPIE